MSTYDWHALAPTRPLPAHDPRYVLRPGGGGDRLARLILGGLAPIAVAGPPGAGKTSEVQRARSGLGDEVFAVDVPADLLVDIGSFDQAAFLYELSHHVLDKAIAHDPEIQPPESLVKDLRASNPSLPRGSGRRMKPVELAVHVIAEVGRMVQRRRVVLLVDGLDRAPTELARAAVRGLVALRFAADVVVVVPPALANGPDSHEVLSNLRLWWVAALPVEAEGADGEEARRFLADVVLRRLELDIPPDALTELLDQAARASGGLLRGYLQLLQDAALYARAAGDDLPDADALAQAASDQADALRRVVEAGDLAFMDAADGSDGLEVPSERRVRLLSHNLLLEYAHGEDRIVRPHPLLRRLIQRRRDRAGD